MDRITLEPGKRGGRLCVRDLRITVYDVLSMLYSGMSTPEILDDFPELTEQDMMAVLALALALAVERGIQEDASADVTADAQKLVRQARH